MWRQVSVTPAPPRRPGLWCPSRDSVSQARSAKQPATKPSPLRPPCTQALHAPFPRWATASASRSCLPQPRPFDLLSPSPTWLPCMRG
eukprot:363917-Chlamydomonas_euryale.AAC.8